VRVRLHFWGGSCRVSQQKGQTLSVEFHTLISIAWSRWVAKSLLQCSLWEKEGYDSAIAIVEYPLKREVCSNFLEFYSFGRNNVLIKRWIVGIKDKEHKKQGYKKLIVEKS